MFAKLFLQVHTHTHSTSPFFEKYISILYVTALGHTSFISTSPYGTVRHCPGWHFVYKYIIILHSVSLPWARLPLQVYHHTELHTVHHHTLLYVIGMGPLRHSTSLPWILDHTSFKSTSPYCTLHHTHGLHFSCNCITILQSTQLPGVTLVLQIHHNTIL